MITKENINGVVVFSGKAEHKDYCFVKGVGDGVGIYIECLAHEVDDKKIMCSDYIKEKSTPWNG